MTDLDLDQYLPYLLDRAGSRIAAAFSERLRTEGIDLRTWRVLAALHHASRQRIGDIAALTSIETSTLSRLIGRMERADLVRRQRLASDQRGVRVAITEAGAALTERLIPRALDYQRIALDGFSREEEKALKSMLKRVFANMADLEGPGRVDAA